MGPFQIPKIASFTPHFTVGFCVCAFLGLAFGQKPFREYIPMEGAASSSILPSDYQNKSELVLGRLMYPSGSGGGGRGGRGGGNWLNGGTNWTVDYSW